MIRVCTWCREVIGEKEPLEDKSKTHGICESCLEVVRSKPNPLQAAASSE